MKYFEIDHNSVKSDLQNLAMALFESERLPLAKKFHVSVVTQYTEDGNSIFKPSVTLKSWATLLDEMRRLNPLHFLVVKPLLSFKYFEDDDMKVNVEHFKIRKSLLGLTFLDLLSEEEHKMFSEIFPDDFIVDDATGERFPVTTLVQTITQKSEKVRYEPLGTTSSHLQINPFSARNVVAI